MYVCIGVNVGTSAGVSISINVDIGVRGSSSMSASSSIATLSIDTSQNRIECDDDRTTALFEALQDITLFVC